MKAEIRNKALNWFEKFINGGWFDSFCVVVIAFAVLYFGAVAAWKLFF